MSAIEVAPVTAVAYMACVMCSERFISKPYRSLDFRDDERACEPGFRAGWRIFAGGHGQRAYCPDHEPTVPMYLVNGGGR